MNIESNRAFRSTFQIHQCLSPHDLSIISETPKMDFSELPMVVLHYLEAKWHRPDNIGILIRLVRAFQALVGYCSQTIVKGEELQNAGEGIVQVWVISNIQNYSFQKV